MKIISWNTNGLTARMEDFFNYLAAAAPDICAIQETRLSHPLEDFEGLGYDIAWNIATSNPGYSGTAILYKHKPLNMWPGLNIREFDEEARMITLEYPDYFFVNVYVPNSASDPVRRRYRIDFDTAFRKYINSLQRRGKNIVIAGDFNVAHHHIDIYPENTRNQEDPPGFLSYERDNFDELLDLGLVDVFRYLHPNRKHAYTWWSSHFDTSQNKGRRLDYFLVSESLIPNVKRCDIRKDIRGSDHAPIELHLENMDTEHNDKVLEKKWDKLNWPVINEKVAELQKTIALMAYKHQSYTRRDVTRAQKKLIKSLEARVLAVCRVADRASAHGIDEVMWRTGAQKMRAALSMSTNTFIAQPTRFVTVFGKKKGQKDRDVHIPTVYDRAMQMLYALALDPIAESTGDKKSFAFRKGRSSFDLHAHIIKTLNGPKPPKFIVKADIKMYYSSISHKWLKEHIPISPYILGQFLEAGHVLQGELFPPEDVGISIGTSISPIIGNMVLDGAQRAIYRGLHGKDYDIDYADGDFLRFADDVVITARSRESAEKSLQILETFIEDRGLGFSPEKTRIIDLDVEGFDLMSRHYKLVNDRISSMPSEDAVNRLVCDLEDFILKYRGGQASLIQKINQKLQGWASYHKITDADKTFRKVDCIVSVLLLRLCKKKHTWPEKRIIEKYFYKERDGHHTYAVKDKPNIRIMRLADVAPVVHKPISLIKNPYIDIEYYETKTNERLIQSATGKYKAVWTRQKGVCYYCGRSILKDEVKCIVPIDPSRPPTLTNAAYVHDCCSRGTKEFFEADEEIKCRLDFYNLITQTKEQRLQRKNRFFRFAGYMSQQKKAVITLNFSDIEEIIGKPLCDSARLYRHFWSRRHEAEISACWINNGYRLDKLDLDNHTITLEKVKEKEGVTIDIPAVLIEDRIPAAAAAEISEYFEYFLTKYGLSHRKIESNDRQLEKITTGKKQI